MLAAAGDGSEGATADTRRIEAHRVRAIEGRGVFRGILETKGACQGGPGRGPMISFHETVESLERVNDLLKSAAEVRSAVSHTLELLADFTAMLEYSHTKEFKDTGEALDYVDKVLVPRVSRIRDALASQTEPHLGRLELAHESASRLVLRLQMLSDGGGAGLVP